MGNENVAAQLREMADQNKPGTMGLVAAAISDIIENQGTHTDLLNEINVANVELRAQVNTNTEEIDRQRTHSNRWDAMIAFFTVLFIGVRSLFD